MLLLQAVAGAHPHGTALCHGRCAQRDPMHSFANRGNAGRQAIMKRVCMFVKTGRPLR